MALIGSSNSLGGLAGSNSIARLLVVISGNTSQLSAALASAEGQLSGFGRNATTIGNALTRTVTLPALALGGAAIKMASDFQSAIARVAGLTPLMEQTGKTAEQLGQQILDIASDPKIVAGPTDLANALYFAGSAGLKASEAFQVVKLSAEAQSIGMGDAADVAKVLIFAMNNYRGTAFSVATAMDAMTAAIKEGTAEPEELAISLGRLLPVAREAGVSFQQVVASVASLTNLGVPTRVATTSLRALFGQLLSPTIQATELLNELGITAEHLREQFALGPIAAFKLLEKATGGNIDQLHDIIPQIRAFTAYLGLTGTNLQRYRQVQDAVNHSSGAFKKALEEISKTPGFKFQKAIQSLQRAGIAFGQSLFPVFEAVSKVLQTIGETLASIPKPALDVLAALLTMAAAAGPLLKLYGALTAVRNITTAGGFTLIAPTWKAIATNIGLAAVAGILAYGSFKNLASGTGSLITMAVLLGTTFIAARTAIFGVQQAISALASEKLATGVLSGFLGLSAPEITAIAIGIAAVVTAIGFFIGQSKKAAVAAKEFKASLVAGLEAGDSLGDTLNRIADNHVRDSLTEIAHSMGLLGVAASQALPQLQKGVGDNFANQLGDLQTKLADFPDSVVNAAGDLRTMIGVAQKAASAGKRIGPALDQAGFSFNQFRDALGNNNLSLVDDDTRKLATHVSALGQAYTQIGPAQQQFQNDQRVLLGMQAAEGVNIDKLAAHYGVSTDYIKSNLQSLGQTATGVMHGNQAAFEEAAVGADNFAHGMTLSMKEAQDAVVKMSVDMSKSIGDALDIFAETPAKIDKSTAQIVKHAGDMAALTVKAIQNVQNLAGRGVPGGLLQKLVDEGPAMVQKFVDATGPELKKLVTAYEVALGATDDKILVEALHQEKKGANMVERFTTAILSSSRLPADAARVIMGKVTAAFNAGDLSKAGVDQITQFIQGLSGARAKGLTRQEAGKVAITLADAIISGNYVDHAGHILVTKLGAAIAASLGIPKAKGVQLVGAMTTGIREGQAKASAAAQAVATHAFHGLQVSGAEAVGAAMVNSFAAGVTLATPQAVDAAYAAAQQIKSGFYHGLHSSPKLFTYYAGVEVMKQMQEGMRKGERYLTGARPYISLKVPESRTPSTDSHDHGPMDFTMTNWEEGKGFIEHRARNAIRKDLIRRTG